MNDNRWYTYVAAGLALTLVAGLLIGYGAARGHPTAAPPSGSNGSAAPVDYFSMTIAWNPASGLDEYFPGNFTLPSHTLVQITITSYDNGTNLIAPAYSTVLGTVGGVETIASDGATHTVSSVPTTAAAHTFTVLASGAGGGMGPMAGGPMFNVVVPPAPAVNDPVVVTFDAYFNVSGTFTWMCMAPCDNGAMATPGLMTGTVTID